MNLNKYNFYRNSVYYLIANGIVALAGLIVVLVCGFNLDTSIQTGRLIFSSAMSIILSLVAILIYVGLRYDFAKAFSIVVSSVHNILLSLAIIAIIRIPVSESLIMGFILLIGLTTYFTLVMTEKLKDVNLKKADYNQIIKDALNSSIKTIVVVCSIVVAVLLLGLVISSSSMFDLVREFLVMMAVIIYSNLVLILPLWCFFSSKIKKIKRAKVDTSVENQKVVKAVTLPDGEKIGEATIDNQPEENSENTNN